MRLFARSAIRSVTQPYRGSRNRLAVCQLAERAWMLLGVMLLASATRGGEIDYQQEVLPLLQQYCVDCHGPDVAEANLRLDSVLGSLRGGDSGEAAIVPGASEQSYLITRVRHADPSKRMPPDSPPLEADEIAVLQAWIDDASAWSAAQAELAEQKVQHWAFEPLSRPQPPPGDLHPVDAFVDAKLAEVGLQRSAPANRRMLIRRLYLVMHGLPPTPEQVETFVNDREEPAWPKLIEQVLNSEHYGERWATHWLDLVRFGESTGFETNRERPHAWRYRDWVIEAFNRDKPYDQFIVEQLAGDAVGADIGTGFLVAGPHDLVKGENPELQQMQRQDELADIINTTGTAFLGLSLGCARCHNHKFDPVSQSDYYALQAVFAGVEHGDRALPPQPSTWAQLAELDEEIAQLQQQLVSFAVPPADRSPERTGTRGEATAAERLRLRPAVTAQLNTETFPPTAVRYVRFTIEAAHHGEPCIDEWEIFAGEENVALASRGAVASSSGDFVHPLHQLSQIHDGRYGNEYSWIARDPRDAWVQIELPEVHTVDAIRWGRDRTGQYRDRVANEYRIEGSLDGERWTLLATSASRLTYHPEHPINREDASAFFDFDSFPPERAAAGRKLLNQLLELSRHRDAVSQPVLAYAGTFHQPGPTHRLYRGEPSAPREIVAPGAITALTDLCLPLDAPEQERRLALARWIASAENPLTARVIVNRVWQHHFGTGLVATPSDFGVNGAAPSHPELLDWLAAELIDSGWSLKHLQRIILTSQTWQQDSRPHAAGIAQDTAARWLWRFPPRRLEAEAIRDSLLVVSGKLDTRLGGPGFSGFEVEIENVRHYFPKTSFGPEDWRRMVYMNRVRQEREAVFGVFDCPDFNQVVPQRTRSTTPLQALNLFNSGFVWQQAGFLADRLSTEAPSPRDKVIRAYELAFNRPPQPDEIDAALHFVEQTDWQQFARVLLNSNEFVLIP
mgnify:CR=1 FL=1